MPQMVLVVWLWPGYPPFPLGTVGMRGQLVACVELAKHGLRTVLFSRVLFPRVSLRSTQATLFLLLAE